jgi:hypothetical protein
MNTLNRYLPFVMFLFFFQFSSASGLDDAVYNKIKKEYTLHPDGSMEYREYKELTLLTYMSFHRLFGETFIVYDPGYQQLEIHEAYTIMADGMRVDVPDNGFNEVLPRQAANAPAYNRLREMVVTHTGLEVGATIYLDYSIKTAAGHFPAFMGEDLTGEMVPLREKKVIIRIPESETLHYKMLNLRTAPEIRQEDGMQVYTFTFREQPATPQLWGTDPTQLPRLFFSTAKDMERAYFPFVAQDAFRFQATAEMEAAVKLLKEEQKSNLEVALAIQKMVVDEIGTWNIPLEYTGFSCRTPAEVWQSNGGTVAEKSILLTSLLLQAGLQAEALAIIPDKYFDRSTGSLYVFNGFAVRVNPGTGEHIYLSATRKESQDLAFTLAGNKLLILNGAIESLKTFDIQETENQALFTGELRFEEDRLAGSLNIFLSHAFNPYFSLTADSAHAKKYADGAGNAVIRDLNREHARFDVDFVSPAPARTFAGYLFIKLPRFKNGTDSWGYPYVESERKLPIRLPYPVNEKYVYALSLPDGHKLISPTGETEIENEVGKIIVKTELKGNSLIYTRELRLNTSYIEYTALESFEELWKVWMDPSHRELVLKMQ